MSKIVALVGHCGPDSTYLRIAISRSIKDAKIVVADDDAELSKVLQDGVDLILFNRELGYGFSDSIGVNIISKLHKENVRTRMMLISNYPEAQQAAVAAGALPGFGKRELGTSRVAELLQSAVAG